MIVHGKNSSQVVPASELGVCLREKLSAAGIQVCLFSFSLHVS